LRIFTSEANEAVLFIGLNNPYAGTSMGLNFCASACASISGITKDYGITEKGAFQVLKLAPKSGYFLIN
jgi:hypothetical protein